MADMAMRYDDGRVDDFDMWAEILDPDEMPDRPPRAPQPSEAYKARVREKLRAKLTVLGGAGSGNFGHSGGEGGKGNPGGSSGKQVLTTVAEATAYIRNAVGHDNVIVADMTLPIKAAQIVGDTLKEMKDRGYKMPLSVEVMLGLQTTPGGEMTADAIDGKTQTALIVKFPAGVPDNLSVDDIVLKAFGGKGEGTDIPKYTVRSVRDVVIHEMGHIQMGSQINAYEWGSWGRGWGGRWKDGSTLAKSVSNYASTSPDEFVAEAFTRLYRGESLSGDAMNMYRDLQGPEARK